MRPRLFYLLGIALLCANLAFGQCIDRDSLWNRLQTIQKDENGSPAQYLPFLINQAELIKNCPYKNDSTHAFLLRTIGDLEFKSGEYVSAIKYFRQAIDITTSYPSKASVHPKELIMAYYHLSDVYEALNDNASKMAALDSCSALGMRLNAVDAICLWGLYSRVQYFFNVGDYRRCAEHASMCEKLGKKFFEESPKANASGLRFASSSLHWHVNALIASKKYSDAEVLLMNRLNDNQQTELNFNRGTLVEQLAEVQVEKGEFRKALNSFSLALALEKKTDNRIGQKSILNNIGYFIYHRNNNPDSAIYYYRKALSIKNIKQPKEQEAIETLNILNNVAGAYVIKNDYDSAFRYFQLAFDQIKVGTNENEVLKSSQFELSQLRKIRYITSLFVEKAAAFHAQFRATKNEKYVQEAIRIYKLSDLFLDKVKASQFDEDSKLFWRGDSRKMYEQAIDACHSSGNINEAFYFFEKSRAVLLNDQLNLQRWLNKEDILRQTLVKRKILQLEREANSLKKESPAYQKIQDKLFFAKKELDSLTGTIKQKNPLYFQNYLDSTIISLQDVKSKVLKDHQGVVEIFSGDSAVYALVLTADKNLLNKINKADFDSYASEYLSFLASPAKLNSGFQSFQKVAAKLYRLLFANANLPTGRIVISPDGQYFPFESLIVDPSRPESYFLNDYAVSYTYSVRYLLNQFNNKNYSATGTFLGVAPINFPASFDLASLKGSDASLQKLRDYYSSGTTFVGSEASRNNFLQKFGSYSVIQLYAHAIDSGSNGEPVIYFSDSALLLSDLFYQNETISQLIVLSACKTGKGKLYQGEGVFSFNRGFAAAGIPTSIVNLWSVEDESTYRLMELFNKYLSEGYSTDVALQKAKLKFISNASAEHKLPSFWAASILIGINDTISDKKPWGWEIIITGLALISLLTILIARKYRRSIKFVK